MKQNKVDALRTLLDKSDEFLIDSLKLEGHELDEVKEIVKLTDEIVFGSNHENDWMTIFIDWQRSQSHSRTTDGLMHFLDTHYISPTRK